MKGACACLVLNQSFFGGRMNDLLEKRLPRFMYGVTDMLSIPSDPSLLDC